MTFLTAPLLGYLNLRAVTGEAVAPEHRPGPVLRGLTWLAVVSLGALGVVYLLSLSG